jgi:hypothetical protein
VVANVEHNDFMVMLSANPSLKGTFDVASVVGQDVWDCFFVAESVCRTITFAMVCVHLLACLFIHLFACLFICLFVHFVCLFICLFDCLFVHFFVNLLLSTDHSVRMPTRTGLLWRKGTTRSRRGRCWGTRW